MNIAMLLSGGVDSSVALHLLQQQGHTITAFYLKIWLEDELSFLGTCPWEEDLNYVRAVCAHLNVPLEIISFQHEYREKIISYVLQTIKSGCTPNPDVLCNQQIKFGAFYDKIGDQFDYIATGHYARRIDKDGTAWLAQAPDPIKDQTYFLCQLSQQQLKKALFPLGELNKSEVREIARAIDLPNKDRKDSQGICFLGKLKFDEFIKFHTGELAGDLVEYETNKKVGAHKGFWFYTIGQRHSIGLSGGPWYVVLKKPETNQVFISRNYYAVNYARDRFIIEHVNWISEPYLSPIHGQPEDNRFLVKLRHGKAFASCTIEFFDSTKIRVKLDSQDQGIAPGQFAVLYKDGLCFGGGAMLLEND